jgi:hypothetical protein
MTTSDRAVLRDTGSGDAARDPPIIAPTRANLEAATQRRPSLLGNNLAETPDADIRTRLAWMA